MPTRKKNTRQLKKSKGGAISAVLMGAMLLGRAIYTAMRAAKAAQTGIKMYRGFKAANRLMKTGKHIKKIQKTKKILSAVDNLPYNQSNKRNYAINQAAIAKLNRSSVMTLAQRRWRQRILEKKRKEEKKKRSTTADV